MIGLVADVGATNARFCLCSEDDWLSDPLVLPTAAFTTQEELLEAVAEELAIADLDAAFFAVAGPPDGQGSVRLTNTGLVFSEAGSAEVLQCPVGLVNDFHAVAAYVPHATDTIRLGEALPTSGVKAVLGAGTGLGMATVVPNAGSHQILTGEGGHANLAPGSHLEIELWGILAAREAHVSRESVLSGPGLVNLYRAVATVWGSQPEELTAAQVSARGMTLEDPVCHQTLDVFCGLLGAAAGDLALTVGATGGVYLAGGIVPQLAEFVRTSGLRRRFDEKGPMSHYVKAISLEIITDQQPGLEGARICLNAPSL